MVQGHGHVLPSTLGCRKREEKPRDLEYMLKTLAKPRKVPSPLRKWKEQKTLAPLWKTFEQKKKPKGTETKKKLRDFLYFRYKPAPRVGPLGFGLLMPSGLKNQKSNGGPVHFYFRPVYKIPSFYLVQIHVKPNQNIYKRPFQFCKWHLKPPAPISFKPTISYYFI